MITPEIDNILKCMLYNQKGLSAISLARLTWGASSRRKEKECHHVTEAQHGMLVLQGAEDTALNANTWSDSV